MAQDWRYRAVLPNWREPGGTRPSYPEEYLAELASGERQPALRSLARFELAWVLGPVPNKRIGELLAGFSDPQINDA